MYFIGYVHKLQTKFQTSLCYRSFISDKNASFVLLLEFDEAVTSLLTLIKNVFATLLYQCVTFVVNLWQRKCRFNNSTCYVWDKESVSLPYFSPNHKLKLIKKHRFINKNIYCLWCKRKVHTIPFPIHL